MAKKTSNTGTVVAVSAGVAALGAAAYLLFGPEGKKHQKDLKSWMLKMKADVMEKMEKAVDGAKDLSAEAYEDIVSAVEAKYKAMKNVDADTLAKEVASLKKNWRAMTKMAKAKKGGAKKAVKKAVKKAGKK